MRTLWLGRRVWRRVWACGEVQGAWEVGRRSRSLGRGVLLLALWMVVVGFFEEVGRAFLLRGSLELNR